MHLRALVEGMFFSSFRCSRRGFSILELVSVLVISGILSGLGAASYLSLSSTGDDEARATETLAAVRDAFSAQIMVDADLLDVDEGEVETGVALVIRSGELSGLSVGLRPGTDGTSVSDYVVGGALPSPSSPGTLLASGTGVNTGWWNTNYGTNAAFHTTVASADSAAVELYTGNSLTGAPICEINGAAPTCDATSPYGGGGTYVPGYWTFPTTCSGRTSAPHASCLAWAMKVSFTYQGSATGSSGSYEPAHDALDTNPAIVDFSDSTSYWTNKFHAVVAEAADGQVVFSYGDHYNHLRWAPPVGTLTPGWDYVLEVVYQGTLTGVASDHLSDYYDAFDIELYAG